ncbi:hypothetical protein SS1G_05103 [Sclerotinia sclerotiorum 1980 UF-70]|uniref:Uncharacterized protein n=2 Tax=Sclerotinia sclerotiorum (strain ATCC 18683 / 1980 / Ss-1) TaxID=665079 RepID=A7EIG0_SCLS1|nr:hypothetical protein SS1G_05103 [Sclerotinia sclerotiorum 1980 UF-70]APA11648.1 hypothetical protein sscle_08g064180 [Sclerotinia sclerotiorum 1980 UF-70]EDO02626.1 hypothetical protein SS1G_05103 [Sclerotinia sclerotiorum 1980 UF-70]
MVSILLKTVALLSLVGFSVADLHKFGICADLKGDGYVYNSKATQDACTAYKNRNTGNKQWDKCPDCYMDTVDIPHCHTNGWHMGGDEWSYYCKQKGAGLSLAN